MDIKVGSEKYKDIKGKGNTKPQLATWVH